MRIKLGLAGTANVYAVPKSGICFQRRFLKVPTYSKKLENIQPAVSVRQSPRSAGRIRIAFNELQSRGFGLACLYKSSTLKIAKYDDTVKSISGSGGSGCSCQIQYRHCTPGIDALV